jgi:beta-1,4-N-acetylglucosaminyltransferase
MNKRNYLRIGVACSVGGHMVQARQLEAVYDKYDHFYFTFSCSIAESMKKTDRVRSIPNIVRYNPFSWISGIFLSAIIALIERPDIVICTGSGVTVFFCLFTKILRTKIIFIESMAKVEKPTLTARMIYPISDLFIVQWPDLLKYFPKAKYVGRLF